MTRQRQSHQECLETLEMMKSNYHRAYNEFIYYSKNCIGLKFNKLVNELHKRSYDRIIKGLFKLNCYILKNKLSKSKQILKTKIEKDDEDKLKIEKLKSVEKIVVEEEKLKKVEEIVVEEEKLKSEKLKKEKLKRDEEVEEKLKKEVKSKESVVRKYKRVLEKKCRKCKLIDCVEKNYGMCENCREIK